MKKLLSRLFLVLLACTVFFTLTGQAMAGLHITEWMYKGDGGEFFELTNTGDNDINLAGWSYDDDSGIAGTFDLSSLGVIAAGESVIVTEDTAAQFSSDWGLDASVKVIGGVTNNIGSSDTINIYDASDSLMDTLTYEKGTIKANSVSGNPINLAALGVDDDSLWVLASVGDKYGSWASALGDVGNPGVFALSEVPVPGAVWLLGSCLLGIVGVRRSKNA
jgi:predicted extracellular nuclease